MTIWRGGEEEQEEEEEEEEGGTQAAVNVNCSWVVGCIRKHHGNLAGRYLGVEFCAHDM